MRWFAFTARHHARGLAGAADQIAHEMFSVARPVLITSGKVRAWTRWGARRYIRRMLGAQLIEIVSVQNASEP